MKYFVGDEVVLKVDDVFGYKDVIMSRLKVMILGYDLDTMGFQTQYLCYIPPYERVPVGFKTFKIDQRQQRHFKFDPKFIGDDGCFITSSDSIHKHIPAPKGERCDRCRDFHEGATRAEDGTYRCRGCRENPYR